MRILGIDPGPLNTGYGLIDVGDSLELVTAGCITTDAVPHRRQLIALADELNDVVTRWRPDAANIELVYLGRNAKSAMAIAEAIGVVRYVLNQHDVTVTTVWPWEVKRHVTGKTTASKRMVQQFVSKRLTVAEVIEPHHASDALAAAIFLADQVDRPAVVPPASVAGSSDPSR